MGAPNANQVKKGKARRANTRSRRPPLVSKRDKIWTPSPFLPHLVRDVVINASGLQKGYPGRGLLIDNLNCIIPPGSLVGIGGGNGAGKTTFFRMVTGEEKPDSGDIAVGETVKLMYVDQSRDSLDPEKIARHLERGAKKSPSVLAKQRARTAAGTT